jgi:uncharacterized protein (DUF488 family)
MPTIATVGVYEFDAAGFIRTLDAAGVTQVVDIRQRRGVRGSEYAWANARRLQALLADAHSPEYIRAYTVQILDHTPLEPVVEQLPVHGIGALLCVESTARACHRSLVAERLADCFGFEVIHLEPTEPMEIDLG